MNNINFTYTLKMPEKTDRPLITIIQVIKHTNEEYNVNPDIGNERAKSTREYLTDHDIGTYRIRVKSICGSKFENDNLTGYLDSSWLLNSRVHFTPFKLDEERIGLKD
ncbi:MAG: hypothetical protein WBD99_04185 [Thermodesulfobacteriota bacterium]